MERVLRVLVPQLVAQWRGSAANRVSRQNTAPNCRAHIGRSSSTGGGGTNSWRSSWALLATGKAILELLAWQIVGGRSNERCQVAHGHKWQGWVYAVRGEDDEDFVHFLCREFSGVLRTDTARWQRKGWVWWAVDCSNEGLLHRSMQFEAEFRVAKALECLGVLNDWLFQGFNFFDAFRARSEFFIGIRVSLTLVDLHLR